MKQLVIIPHNKHYNAVNDMVECDEETKVDVLIKIAENKMDILDGLSVPEAKAGYKFYDRGASQVIVKIEKVSQKMVLITYESILNDTL